MIVNNYIIVNNFKKDKKVEKFDNLAACSIVNIPNGKIYTSSELDIAKEHCKILHKKFKKSFSVVLVGGDKLKEFIRYDD